MAYRGSTETGHVVADVIFGKVNPSGKLSVTPNVSGNGTATVRFTVTNTGAEDGTDIVPVYVSQPVSGVVTPPQRLVGFTRVTLKAHHSKRVRVRFPVSALAE